MTTADTRAASSRVSTIDPIEFHHAIVSSAVTALREGRDVELLDGLAYWTSAVGTMSIIDERALRRSDLETQLDQVRSAYRQARQNANSTENSRVRADYITDSEQHAHTLDRLEQELADLDALPSTQPVAAAFNSEADFIAHAISGLVRNGEWAPPGAEDALSQVLEFTAFRPIVHTEPPMLEAQFNLLVPADGRVARFGPITCRVRDRTYRKTLDDHRDITAAKSLVSIRRADGANATGHRAVKVLAALLENEAGWERLPAATLAISNNQPLYDIAGNLLWDDPAPSDLDPAYVQHVIDTYTHPEFRWRPGFHAVHLIHGADRQTCIDVVVANGGEMTLDDLVEATAGDVTIGQIYNFTVVQQLRDATPWYPGLHRVGCWQKGRRAGKRSLRAVPCPHCDGWASRVMRTPETLACLLCPDCRRMPTTDSPHFPNAYLNLAPVPWTRSKLRR